MAVTSIWPIKGRVDRVINYARNPEKTTDRKELNDIKAEQREKAAKGKEQSKPTKGPKHKAPRKYKPKRLKER